MEGPRRSTSRREGDAAGDRSRRDAVYGHGSKLRGVDLEEQIATNASIQRQRWIDIYYRLWERKAKVDITDTIVIVDGRPRDWFFTSAVTGEIQRKSDSHLTAIAIKKHFVKKSEPTAVARQIALLIHEDTHGDLACARLSDLDFNLVLCQATSPLWASSFLLQPHLPASRQHPQWPGTFVAKFHTTSTSSIRVLHFSDTSGFHELKQTRVSTTITPVALDHPSSSTINQVVAGKPRLGGLPRGVEELIRMETTKIVAELEASTKDKDSIRQLHAEFQITHTHRLVLRRVSRVVYASDLKRATQSSSSRRGTSDTRKNSDGRPSSASTSRTNSSSSSGGQRRCAGARFCHCSAFATGEINKTNTAISKTNDLQQITRKSLLLCEDESAFLDKFGAHAESHLESQTVARVRTTPSSSLSSSSSSSSSGVVGSLRLRQEAHEAFERLLQRRLFMLRSTLWNPDSHSFDAKPLAWEDEHKKQSQQYEMVRVCRTCYLIYHTMDAERFQATKSTVKAAARRLTMLHNAKMIGQIQHRKPKQQSHAHQHAWEAEEEIETQEEEEAEQRDEERDEGTCVGSESKEKQDRTGGHHAMKTIKTGSWCS